MREPILWQRNHDVIADYYERTGNTSCFYEQRLDNGTWFGLVKIESTGDVWNCTTRNKRFMMDGDFTIGSEKFFDILSIDYPDEFEWFLFHPELF